MPGKDRRVPTTPLDLIHHRLDHLDRQHKLTVAAGRSPTVPRYDPEFPLDGIEGQIALHTGEHVPPPTDKTPFYYADGDWHPFIQNLGAGIVGALTPFDLATITPGTILWRYRAGDLAGDLTDTAGYAGGPRNATYVEATGGADPFDPTDIWDPSHAVTRGVAHTELGTADDKGIQYVYRQHNTAHNALYPGAWFRGVGDSTRQWAKGGGLLKTVIAFFNVTAGSGIPSIPILSTTSFSSTNSGPQGWMISVDTATNILTFQRLPIGISLSTPGGITPGRWYCVAVTYDVPTDTFSLYLNGFFIASVVAGVEVNVGADSALEIGHAVIDGSFTFSTSGDRFFYGKLDELVGYGVTLTAQQVADISRAVGLDFGITTYGAVTIGTTEDFGSAFGISSGFALEHEMVAADGAGGTKFEYPTTITYTNGA